jgi:hypothetical protein
MLLLAIFILSLMSIVNDQMMKIFFLCAPGHDPQLQSVTIKALSLLTLSDCTWLVIASGTCWQLDAKVRWASACYQADMEKRSCIAPEHFGFIQIRKICCCTWNNLAFLGSEANVGVQLSGDKLIENWGGVVGSNPCLNVFSTTYKSTDGDLSTCKAVEGSVIGSRMDCGFRSRNNNPITQDIIV